jgi:DNA polymerase (family X)
VSGALPTNAEVAASLELLGDLLEIEGADRHRVLAYRRGATRIRAHPVSVAEMALAKRATELPDVGATLQAKVAELAETGEIQALGRLRERVPPGLAQVARLTGMGPSRARAVWRELGVTDIDGLRAALEDGRLRGVTGIGPKLIAGLGAQLSAPADEEPPAPARIPLGRALPLAEGIAADVVAATGARVEVAGSARRGLETVKDVDLVAASADPESVADALAAHPATQAVLSRGPSRTAVMTHSGLRIELRVGPPESHGNLMQHLTGSAAHNVRLREQAVRRGLSLSEHGVTGPDGEISRHAEEAELYAELGLPLIPPELREDVGEIEVARAGRLPRLVDVGDLRGDLHVHTDWSDGSDTLEAMVAAARARGYAYVGISDHSQARGLDPDRVARQWERIERLNERLDDIRVLRCTEVDILADGRLDFDDELLARFDYVTASVHSAFRQGSDRLTARIVGAIENPHVDAIGHPTGRMMGRRGSYALDLERVFERAAATGTLLEVNSQPARLDLNDAMARRALDAGVRLVIGSDAHTVAGLGFIRYGVMVARRAAAGPDAIANTSDWEGVLGGR